MRRRSGFASYQEFRREVLGAGIAPVAAALEDMADEIYHAGTEELDALWDSPDSEEE